jgi:hypothetical protein
MGEKRVLGFRDITLSVFYSIFGLEAISASAAIGNSGINGPPVAYGFIGYPLVIGEVIVRRVRAQN